MKKILYIYTDWNSSEARVKAKGWGGVAYYRVMKPAEALRSIGWDVTVAGHDLTEKFGKTVEELWTNIFSQFDAVVCKQMDNPRAAAPLFFFAQKFNKPVILDLDDDYFAVKPGQPAWEHYHPGSQKRAIFAATLSLVDAVFVSTQPLKESYEKSLRDVYGIEMPIYVLPNCNVRSEWPAHLERRDKKDVTIGYAGSITHNADLQMVMPAIMSVLEKYPRVSFEIMGAIQYGDVLDAMTIGHKKGVRNRVRIKGGTHSWTGYPEKLTQQNWDIGICPLVDDQFCRGKSHIKWMEYTMAGLPVIASPTYPYIEPVLGIPVIEDGVTGFFARSTDEWTMLLSRLIEDGSARRELAGNAMAAIEKNWQYSTHAHLWANALTDVLCNFQTRRTKMALSKTAKTPAASETPEFPGRQPS